MVLMKAAVYDELGPASVLHLADIDRPDPGPGEVRVNVHVSGVNPTDWKSRASRPGNSMPFAYVVPNQDGAGEIDAVGEGVDPSRLGERVWIWFGQWQRQHGTAAEWICLPSRQAVKLPDESSYELGASLGIPALRPRTRCCRRVARPRRPCSSRGAPAPWAFTPSSSHAGEGATVVTTVSSPDKGDIARAAGAHFVVDYRNDDVSQAVRSPRHPTVSIASSRWPPRTWHSTLWC